MNIQRRRPGAGQTGQKGFALPLALVAIASLAIITLVGYRTVAGAAAIVVTMQENADIEQALFSAEAETVFTYLSSPIIPSGIAMDPATLGSAAIDGIDVSTLADDQLWRANGAARRSNTATTPIVVTYFDASGFAPIGALQVNQLAALLSAAGFDRNDVDQLAARIADFQDYDSTRRFQGAERAEYRLFGALPPTNSPLRSVGELEAVLGYTDKAPASSWSFLEEYASFGGLVGQFKPRLGPPLLADIIVDEEDAGIAADPFGGYDAASTQPTDTARFLLSPDGTPGLTRRRAVEIMRTANAPDRPFRRVWIYDKVHDDNGSQTAKTEQHNMAPVFQPTSGADPR